MFVTLAMFHCNKNSFTRMFKEVRDDAEGFSNAWFAKRTEGRGDGKYHQLLAMSTHNLLEILTASQKIVKVTSTEQSVIHARHCNIKQTIDRAIDAHHTIDEDLAFSLEAYRSTLVL